MPLFIVTQHGRKAEPVRTGEADGVGRSVMDRPIFIPRRRYYLFCLRRDFDIAQYLFSAPVI